MAFRDTCVPGRSVMKLNHLDLQVPDVQATADFFVRFLGFTRQSSPTSPALVILTDGDGFSLVLQRRKETDPPYPEGFHVGCLVDRPELVYDFHTTLEQAGLPGGAVQVNGRGTLLYTHAPGGILVEVSCRR